MKKYFIALVLICGLTTIGTSSAHAFGGGRSRPQPGPQPTATPKITMGEPTYSGSGCPSGTVSTTLSPDGSALSVIYDQHLAEAGHSSEIIAKECVIQVPVTIPNGYRVMEFSVDHRGFASIPDAAVGVLDSKVTLTGARSARIIASTSRSWFTSTNADGDFSVTHKAQGTSTICGGRADLQFGTRLSLRARNADALLSMDSSDAGFTTLTYRLAQCR